MSTVSDVAVRALDEVELIQRAKELGFTVTKSGKAVSGCCARARNGIWSACQRVGLVVKTAFFALLVWIVGLSLLGFALVAAGWTYQSLPTMEECDTALVVGHQDGLCSVREHEFVCRTQCDFFDYVHFLKITLPRYLDGLIVFAFASWLMAYIFVPLVKYGWSCLQIACIIKPPKSTPSPPTEADLTYALTEAVKQAVRDGISLTGKEARITNTLPIIHKYEGTYCVIFGDEQPMGAAFLTKFIENRPMLITAKHVVDALKGKKVSASTQYGSVDLPLPSVAPYRFDDVVGYDIPQKVQSVLGLKCLPMAARIPRNTGVTVPAPVVTGQLYSSAGVVLDVFGFVIAHSANTTEGFSGAPLLDHQNRVIGVHCGYCPHKGQIVNYALRPPYFNGRRRHEYNKSDDIEDIVAMYGKDSSKLWALMKEFMQADLTGTIADQLEDMTAHKIRAFKTYLDDRQDFSIPVKNGYVTFETEKEAEDWLLSQEEFEAMDESGGGEEQQLSDAQRLKRLAKLMVRGPMVRRQRGTEAKTNEQPEPTYTPDLTKPLPRLKAPEAKSPTVRVVEWEAVNTVALRGNYDHRVITVVRKTEIRQPSQAAAPQQPHPPALPSPSPSGLESKAGGTAPVAPPPAPAVEAKASAPAEKKRTVPHTPSSSPVLILRSNQPMPGNLRAALDMAIANYKKQHGYESSVVCEEPSTSTADEKLDFPQQGLVGPSSPSGTTCTETSDSPSPPSRKSGKSRSQRRKYVKRVKKQQN
jgi:hypothetical protein